jgi:hypothetical protein
MVQLREHHCWLWVHCPRWACLHKAPMALAPAIIRWGPEDSSDVLRQGARRSKCGNRGGATLQLPSWAGLQDGFQPFPG